MKVTARSCKLSRLFVVEISVSKVSSFICSTLARMDRLTLMNGKKLPNIGLGTWQAKPGEVAQAVKDAIDVGYRHIDCAMVYGNEAEIGVGIRSKIAEGVVKREELFITSKLWNTFHKPEMVVNTCRKTLSDFGLEQIDLYLIHWPLAFKQYDIKENAQYFPRDSSGKLVHENIDFCSTYKEMEQCVEKGFTRYIGLSNFNSQQINKIFSIPGLKIKPVMNQIECHTYLNQKKLINFCRQKQMMITAYSPLGAPNAVFAIPGTPNLLDDVRLMQLAQKYEKTLAQLILRYLVQLGTIPIPKSVNKLRLEENLNIDNFLILPEDMAYMDTFDCNGRTCPFIESKDDVNYPFGIEY